MFNLANLLLVLIGFGLIVAIHELGHFLAARFFGVRVLKYSLGFGPAIWRRQKGETEYLISLIPLGGYVKMQGDNPDEDDEDEEELDPSRSFLNKAWWQKALIVFAGPLANLFLGFLLFVFGMALPQKIEDLQPVIHSASGKWADVFAPGDSIISLNGEKVIGYQSFLLELYQAEAGKIVLQREGEILELEIAKSEVDSLIKSLQPQAKAVVGEVFTGLPAWRAGLSRGMEIVSVDSVAVADWYDMREKIVQAPAEHVVLGIRQGEDIIYKRIDLQDNLSGKEDSRMIGIKQELPVQELKRYPLGDVLKYGTLSTFNFIGMQYSALLRLSKKPKELKNNVGGPVMLVSMSQEMGQRGLSSLIIFLGSISLILMIMNLLPIPVLDGGHIMFYFIEGLIRRPVPYKLQGILQRIGLVLLVWLMIFAFFADISKIAYRLLLKR